MPLNSTTRFSDRVEDYVRYRPDYPQGLIDWLHREHGVDAGWRVADIGAGTGISTKLFLDAGHRVIAVEPNGPMRAAAVEWLGSDAKFSAIAGSAEATTLPDAGVDLVIAAQAFHWFDQDAVRREWRRILTPSGLAVVFWNSRLLAGSPFLEGYERLLLDYGTDYTSVAERYADETRMRQWFGPGYRGKLVLPHAQKLDFPALRGRLLSSSYAPREGHPKHEPMLAALRELFDATAEDGTVDFVYDTTAYAGRLSD